MDHDKEYVIRLSGSDLGQVIDGLEARTSAWHHTATYLETGEAPDGFLIEECEDAEEARRIAEHYQRILTAMVEQMMEQR
ncbi:MAG TPA: hypothetical protein PL010_06930 [Flavobacteriales bacterium]|nr:hypothetical protein [Flavobacteriales bacterium]HNI04352.1 hypothetical protein [Flavobacteriales bacterium]